MSSDLLLLIVLVLVVLLGSALCSGVEAALLTVNPIRVQELAARERPVAGARRLARVAQRVSSVEELVHRQRVVAGQAPHVSMARDGHPWPA